jgi:Ni2+-binding GTPase involved in maturation of urease and hydrogenase
MGKARYVMLGGFLGAGKSTAALAIAKHFHARDLRVGIITNDQSHGLVDTKLAGSRGLPVEEITGGCFCCRFDSLTEAAEKLSEESRPDVFLAEPVGSCTDLKATVDYPLRRMYGDAYEIAPLSVLVDPDRALRVLGVEAGKSFSPKVIYIYRKQLEEADVIVINKIDALEPRRLESLRSALAAEFPEARIIAVSARKGWGMEAWIDLLESGVETRERAMDVDYDVYAEGEALLGWLNLTARVDASEPFDGNALLLALARDVGTRLASMDAEIAHFKMTLDPDEGNDLAVANVVASGRKPDLAHALAEPLEAGELIVNLRAEADPETLRVLVLDALEHLAPRHEVEHLECFRPARPVPTHRLLTAAGEPT